jgi:hypothetical protein
MKLAMLTIRNKCRTLAIQQDLPPEDMHRMVDIAIDDIEDAALRMDDDMRARNIPDNQMLATRRFNAAVHQLVLNFRVGPSARQNRQAFTNWIHFNRYRTENRFITESDPEFPRPGGPV